MKLRNRFSEEDKIRYWVNHQYCSLCMSNKNCSLHHIDGCKKDCHRSIYNSIMLCEDCHREADTHNTDSPISKEYRDNLRAYTAHQIEKIGRVNNKYDEEYNALY